MTLQARNDARWKWCLVDDFGRLIAAAAIVPDGDKRGWFVGYPGQALRSAAQLRPLIAAFRPLEIYSVYDELRAWVDAEDPIAIRFAEAHGFRYDCGPAHGLFAPGLNSNLYLWRRQK